MKKQYEKPSMKVYELKRRSQILAGSPDPYNQDFGYMPGGNDDMNKTA